MPIIGASLSLPPCFVLVRRRPENVPRLACRKVGLIAVRCHTHSMLFHSAICAKIVGANSCRHVAAARTTCQEKTSGIAYDDTYVVTAVKMIQNTRRINVSIVWEYWGLQSFRELSRNHNLRSRSLFLFLGLRYVWSTLFLRARYPDSLLLDVGHLLCQSSRGHQIRLSTCTAPFSRGRGA